MKRARIITVTPTVVNRVGAAVIGSGVGLVGFGAFSSSGFAASVGGGLGAGMIMAGVAVCAELGTRTDPVMIPIPWPIPMPTLSVVETTRQPTAYPPAPGQCFVCGIIDPDREKSLGTANHPECVEWLGDWKPPAPKIERNRHPIILPDYFGGVTMAQVAENVQRVTGAIRDSRYVFTCKCPDCENHWWFLRTAASGHPKDCYCTACDGVRNARTHLGDHHATCMCHGGLYCARTGPKPGPFVTDGHLTYIGDHTYQEIRDAYADLNARYGGTVYPGHEERVGCTCDVCKLAAEYIRKANEDAGPTIRGRLRQSLDIHTVYPSDMPQPHVLGYTRYPDHDEIRNGICQACKLIADYRARPKRLPPPDPGLMKRVRE